MTCYRNEIFGPVLCVVHVDNLEEAMKLVSEHEYGNGACLFTRDGEAARYFSDNVDAGMVGINVPLRFRSHITVLVVGSVLCLETSVHTGQTECVFTQEGKRFPSVGHLVRPTILRASLFPPAKSQ